MKNEEFKAWRVQHGTQQEIAMKLGVSQATVSCMERGYAAISDEIEELCQIVGEALADRPQVTGSQLLQYRSDHEISRVQLALAFGVTEQTLMRWEKEDVLLPPRHAARFEDLDPSTIEKKGQQYEYVWGSDLSEDDQKMALMITICNRYTLYRTKAEYQAGGRRTGNLPERITRLRMTQPPEFSSDELFLERTMFRTRLGKLDRRQRHMISKPDWPLSEMRHKIKYAVVVMFAEDPRFPRRRANGSPAWKERFNDEALRDRRLRPEFYATDLTPKPPGEATAPYVEPAALPVVMGHESLPIAPAPANPANIPAAHRGIERGYRPVMCKTCDGTGTTNTGIACDVCGGRGFTEEPDLTPLQAEQAVRQAKLKAFGIDLNRSPDEDQNTLT